MVHTTHLALLRVARMPVALSKGTYFDYFSADKKIWFYVIVKTSMEIISCAKGIEGQLMSIEGAAKQATAALLDASKADRSNDLRCCLPCLLSPARAYGGAA